MKKRLFLNTIRSLKSTKSRFFAILAIIAIGCGFFAGVKSAGPDMKKSSAQYLDEQGLADIHLISELGFDEEDIAAVSGTVDTDEIYAGYSADLVADGGDLDGKILKVYSYDPDSGINIPYLTEGRLPEKPDEIIVDERFFSADTPDIGDKIIVKTGDDREISDYLSETEFTVVGKAKSPVYIAYERGNTSIGNGVINGWLLIPEKNFSYDIYTDIYIKLSETKGVDPYTDEYDEIVEKNTEALETLAETQIEHRKEAVLNEAYEEINDAKKELADAEKEYSDGEKEIADGEKEIADNEKKVADAEKEIADGEKEIADNEQKVADAEKEIADGEKEIADNEKKVADAEKEIADGEKEIADGEKEISDAEKEIADHEKEIADGEAEIAENEAALADAEKQIADGRQELADGEAQYEEGSKAVSGLDSLAETLNGIVETYKTTSTSDSSAVAAVISGLDQRELFSADDTLKQLITGYMMTPPGYDDTSKTAAGQGIAQYASGISAQADELRDSLSETRTQLDEAKAELDAHEAELESGRQELENAKKTVSDAKQEISDAKEELNEAKEELQKAKDELENGKKELEDGRKELEDGKKELEDGKKELEDGKKELEDGKKELEDGKKELEDGKKELEDGRKELEDGKKELEDAGQEIADAKQEIADAEQEVHDSVDGAEWYVFDREYNPYYSHYAEDCERVDAIAAVFPIFFILVAALVCCTTMTRMVEEQRTEIGTLKALGYSRSSIISQYVMYAIAASVPGGFIGLLVGFNTLPRVIFVCYQSMYSQPYLISDFKWDYAAGCVITSCLCTGLSALYACRQELVSCPAQLMRPKPPKDGKRILLERIGFIWKRLKFTTKVTFRNLFRYKARLLMTVIGIAGCTALLLTGFGLRESITAIVDRQYGDIFRYDALAAVDDSDGETDYKAVEDCMPTDIVSSEKLVMQVTEDIRNSSGDVYETYLLVPETQENFGNFIDLHTRKDKMPIELSEGVVIGEKLANLLGAAVNDKVYFGESSVPVNVDAICENYTFNYAYMTAETYDKLGIDEGFSGNVFLINMTDTEKTNELSEVMLKNEDVLAVTYSEDGGDKFRDLVDSLSLIVVAIIASAGALAFVVLFNLSNINVNERIRELATIKVLGFYDGEVAAYIYRENMVSTLMGTAVGLVMGIFLEKFVVKTAEVDAVMFAPGIPLYCFIAAAVLTLFFALLVNVTLYFRLKKIDMATSLKAIE